MVGGLGETIGALLKQVPAGVWGTIAGALLSLPALMASLWHARKLQATQLAHDSTERSRERRMSWRREVYLQAAESTSRLMGLLGSLADVNIPDSEISKEFQEQIAKLTKIEVIASVKALEAVDAFTLEFSSLYLERMVDRALLVAQKNEIERLNAGIRAIGEGLQSQASILKEIEQIKEADPRVEAAVRSQMVAENNLQHQWSQQRTALLEQMPRKQLDLLRSCLEATNRIAPLLGPAAAAVREELEIPTEDAERFYEGRKRKAEALKAAVDASLRKVDGFISGGNSTGNTGA